MWSKGLTNEHTVLVPLVGLESFLHQRLHAGTQHLVAPHLLLQRLLLHLQRLQVAPQSLAKLQLEDGRDTRENI